MELAEYGESCMETEVGSQNFNYIYGSIDNTPNT